MIVNDKDADARLNNPMNLINKLATIRETKKFNPMGLFGVRDKDNNNSSNSDNLPARIHQPPVELPHKTIPQLESSDEPKDVGLDDLLDNPENKINLSLAHKSALEVMTNSLQLLATKLDNITPAKLPTVITAAQKVVESVRKEIRESRKTNEDREVHYHFYTPVQKKIADYKIIDV